MGDYTYQVFSVPFPYDGTQTTGDGKYEWKAPCDCKLIHFQGHLATTGSSSGASLYQLYNVTQSLDMLTTGLSIAYNEADGQVAATLSSTEANLLVTKSDVIRLDLDTISTAPADFMGTAMFVGR